MYLHKGSRFEENVYIYLEDRLPNAPEPGSGRGGGTFRRPASVFSCIAKKRRRTAPPFFAYLSMHPFRTLPEKFSRRSEQVRSPGQVK